MFKMKDLVLLLLPITVLGLGDKCDNCLPRPQLRPYEERGCKPFITPECNCPLYYNCPEYPPNPVLTNVEEIKLKQLNGNACIFNGKVYEINQQLDTPCRVCHCRDSGKLQNITGFMIRGDAYGSCADIECPEMFDNILEFGCHHVYATNKCCAVGKICQDDPNVNFKCNYDNQTFNYGTKISLNDDPCKVCLCDQMFDPENLYKSNCYNLQCNLAHEDDKPVFHQQCTPIFFKDSCCSNGFICPKNFDPNDFIPVNLSQNLTDKCVLNGKEYKIGENMLFTVKDTYSQGFGGGECQCRVPPLMTCLYSS